MARLINLMIEQRLGDQGCSTPFQSHSAPNSEPKGGPLVPSKVAGDRGKPIQGLAIGSSNGRKEDRGGSRGRRSWRRRKEGGKLMTGEPVRARGELTRPRVFA